jgi:hypothetical protein
MAARTPGSWVRGSGWRSHGRTDRRSPLTRGPAVRMTYDRGAAAIVRTTVDLARSLGLTVVAEGVESETALLELARLGCDLAQGYHISRPLPAEQLTGWFHTRTHPPPAHPTRHPAGHGHLQLITPGCLVASRKTATIPRGAPRERRCHTRPASEAGGRVGVGPGLLRRPPSSESHGGAHSSSRLAPMPPTPVLP